jgi:hypothetical protein
MRRTATGLLLGALAVAGAGCSGSGPTAAPSRSTTIPGGHQLHAAMDAAGVVSPTSGATTSVPPGLAAASGTFAGRLDGTSRQLLWHLSYKGLGTPTDVTAEIHYGRAGQTGPLLVRLCGPCASSTPSGVVTVPLPGAQALLSGSSWVTVTTATRPDGAVRGQITGG